MGAAAVARNLRLPLYDGGDGLMAQMFVRNIQETGWFLDNGRLGQPGAVDLHDFPMADVLHFGILKALGATFRDPVVVFNVYALLPFPLTALSAYFILRRLRLGRLAALVPSVLYACLPYHFLRMQAHLFLAAYYLLPPMLWVILRVCIGRNPLLRVDPAGGPPRWRLRSWQAAGAALLCVLTGLAGVYYAFFSCFFLLAAGARAAVRERRWALVGAAAVLVLLVGGAVAVALAPTKLRVALHGQNREVASRLPAEADAFGLSVSEMLLPVYHHRIGFLAPWWIASRPRRAGPPGNGPTSRSGPWAPWASSISSGGFCCGGGAGRSRRGRPGLPHRRRRPARDGRRVRLLLRLLRHADDPLLQPDQRLHCVLRAGPGCSCSPSAWPDGTPGAAGPAPPGTPG